MKHASYQLRHILPWAISMFEYTIEKHVLRREVEKPAASRQVYSWVSIRSLEEERQQRDCELQREGEKIEMAQMKSLRQGIGSSTSSYTFSSFVLHAWIVNLTFYVSH
jgi:hypothetical protein